MTAVPDARIVLALDSTVHAAASMAIALHLARDTQAELESVFVEDVDLLNLAALPFTQELGRDSGTLRPMRHADLESLLRRRAEQARRFVAERAGAARLEFSFRVARGTIAREAMDAAATAELVVVAEARSRPPLRRSPGEQDAPVALLLEAGTPPQRSLDTALKLAGGRGSDILLLVSNGSAASAASARVILERARLSHPELARALAIAVSDAGGVLREVRMHHCRAVVVPPGARDESRLALLRLLEQSGFPVVIVS